MPELRILDTQPADLRNHKGPFVRGQVSPIPIEIIKVLDEGEFPIIGATGISEGDPRVYQWSPDGTRFRKSQPGARSLDDRDDFTHLYAAEQAATMEEALKNLRAEVQTAIGRLQVVNGVGPCVSDINQVRHLLTTAVKKSRKHVDAES